MGSSAEKTTQTGSLWSARGSNVFSTVPSRTVAACSIARRRAFCRSSAVWAAFIAGSLACWASTTTWGPYFTPHFTRLPTALPLPAMVPP
jgi:hypothetical protein